MTTPTARRIRVIHGVNDDAFDNIAGENVAAVRAALAAAFNVPSEARAFVNGLPVTPAHRLGPGDTIEFVNPFGVKGALDPDELALLQRIEAKLDRLLPVSAHTHGPAPTSPCTPRTVWKLTVSGVGPINSAAWPQSRD